MGTVDDSAILQDWQSLKTLKQRLKHVFNNELFSDVHFLVGEGSCKQRIPAHKFVLSVGSSVFCTMFHGSFAKNNEDNIEIPDIEPSVFLTLLKFLYLDEVDLDVEIALATMYAARKYAVTILEKDCSEFLQENVTYKNAFMVLTQARLFDITELKESCLFIIDRNPEAFKTANFLEIDLDLLCCVICRNTLFMEEVEIFHAAMKWSVAECRRKNIPVTVENQRTVLGRAFYLLRFPVMNVDEFFREVVELGILNDREVESLIQYMTAKKKTSIDFPCVPRSRQEFVVNRFASDDYSWSRITRLPQRLKFMVDRSIFIIGFNVLNLDVRQESLPPESKCSAFVHLFDEDEEEIGSTETELELVESSSRIFEARFSDEIYLQEKIVYQVAVFITLTKGPEIGRIVPMYSGFDGKQKVSVKFPQGNITFKFSSYSDDLDRADIIPPKSTYHYITNVQRGQIPGIIFRLP